jgi:steroid 5-alpha reductase family enzyme
MNLQRVAISSATIAATLAVAAGVAWAASQDVAKLRGIPVVALCAALAFLLQWVAFVPAYVRQTERFYDLTGSVTYMTVTGFAMVASRSTDLRSFILGLLIFIWAARLGIFLFRRVRAEGGDRRFEDIKPSAARFVVAWTLQGLWVFLTLSAALIAITTRTPPSLGVRDVVGVAIWISGFSVEVIADRQKSRFRAENPGRFVHSGLWAWSRHPNYFGEIVLWTGIFVIASSSLHGWQWVTLISPLFVIVLLTRVSGIPILERQAEERWGDLETYRRYKQSTPVLIPRPPRR